jgi:hypothetical protein
MFNDGIDVDTAADSVVKPYADNYFEYDGSRRVSLETSAVCESCPGGGRAQDDLLSICQTRLLPHSQGRRDVGQEGVGIGLSGMRGAGPVAAPFVVVLF